MKEYSWKDLFKFRNVWMGFAIIWIIIYHSELPVENRLLWMVKNVGYCGVDIFFFASGLGCYYSYQHSHSTMEFFGKRLKRIIPVYWIFLTILYIVQYSLGILRPQYIIGNYFCVEYFKDPELDTAFNWYMGAIWVVYLLTPLFYELISKYRKKSLWMIPLLLMISVGVWHSDNLILLATRVPVYFLGMYYESLALEEKTLSRKSILLHFMAFCIGFLVLVPMRLLITDNTIMWGCGMLFYPFLLMTPFMCIALSIICINIPVFLSPVAAILETAGQYSFELYLVHHLVFEAGYEILKGVSFFQTKVYWLLLYVIVIPAAYLLRICSSSVTEKIFPFVNGKAKQ